MQIVHTPWGEPQHIVLLSEDIVSVSTASHGGLKLSDEQNQLIPEYMRNEDGWYEEDCEWAKVAVVFPPFFKGPERVSAEKVLKHWFPDEWEVFYGKVLKPGESCTRDEEEFRKNHNDSLLVTSAYGSWADWVPAGFVGCVAHVGGRDRHGKANGLERVFLVPAEKYAYKSGWGFL
jgi:hypothetical protein